MIDFHTHILPGIDDGSRDIRMTEAMLREEQRQGVDLVVATPHFYAGRTSLSSFMEKRAEAARQTERLREQKDGKLPEVLSGAEVCYFPGIGEARSVAELCVSGTRTLLLELPFLQWDEAVLRDTEALIEKQGLAVVLAHVERYIGLQKDRRIWNRLMELPLIPQINAGSFLKKGGLLRLGRVRNFCMDFLSGHPDLIVGSDCHNMDDRPPVLAKAREEIEAELGSEMLLCIDGAAGRALAR